MTRLNSGMDLASRWPLPGALGLRDTLLAAYAETFRGYHDQRHLREVLDHLDELAPHTAYDRRAVILAAWFHDGVYDGRAEPEERSARWAQATLPAAGITSRTITEVTRLVRLTEHHRPQPGDVNGESLCDADLAILASGPERYAEYAADVRREYAHIPQSEFAQARARVLRHLVAKPSVFHTAFAIATWEEAARANIARELAHLESLGPTPPAPD